MSAEPTAAVSAHVAARALLSQFDARMLAHGADKNALLAAGVPFTKVEALYPFDLGDYQPAIVTMLLRPELLTCCALALGGGTLMSTFIYLQDEAYVRAEGTVWSHDFFATLPAELEGLVAEIPHIDATDDAETDLNGNAVYLMRQWGYLLLFLHECAMLPAHAEHAEFFEVNGAEQFAKVLVSVSDIARRLLALLDQ